ncbi:MAG: hypothetical protein JO206_15465 [Solirubrobacterales bacterium]|nr:hypothetical protein [Solirubrobacterales bacterium]MBV9474362.1 hypothetical protein [Solirubrobacterales bacterium]MBV9836551.1 hypothetical protein [Solirubrobacterales bacterium]
MAEPEHEQLAEALEQEAKELARKAQELRGEIDDVRQDWRRKQHDAQVPGAVPGEDEDAGEDSPPSGEDDGAG